MVISVTLIQPDLRCSTINEDIISKDACEEPGLSLRDSNSDLTKNWIQIRMDVASAALQDELL